MMARMIGFYFKMFRLQLLHGQFPIPNLTLDPALYKTIAKFLQQISATDLSGFYRLTNVNLPSCGGRSRETRIDLVVGDTGWHHR